MGIPLHFKNIMILQLLLLVCFSCISCSIVFNLKESIKNNPESIISDYIDNFRLKSIQSLLDSQIFDTENYKEFMVGLDSHLLKYALTTYVKTQKTSMSVAEHETFKENFLKTLDLILKEESNFRVFSLESFSYKPATLQYVFSALKAIDPSSETILDPVVQFLKHCKTDSQLKLPLSIILDAFSINDFSLPFIHFHSEIDSCSDCKNFDNFISNSYIKFFPDGSANPKQLLNFSKNVIYGPTSSIANSFFFPMINQDLIKRLDTSESDINQFIKYIIKNEIFDHVMNILEDDADNNCDVFRRFKINITNQYENFKAIMLMRAFEITYNLHSFKERSSALDEYNRIDPVFVKESFVIIYKEFKSLVYAMEIELSIKLLNFYCEIALDFINAFPNIKLDEYEPIIMRNFLLCLLTPEIRTDLFINAELAKKIISLSFVKIDFIIFIKLFTISTLIHPNDEVKAFTDLSMQVILNRSDDDPFEIIQVIHNSASCKTIEISIIVQASIMQCFKRKDYKSIRKILNYSIEHKLLSKAFILVTKNLLKPLNL